MAKQQSIFLIGPMGVGKTSIGRELARQLDLKFFDSDHEVEASTGANITWIFDVEGETGFRDREVKAIDDLTQKQGILLSTGGGSVVRAENRKALAARGIVIYLYSSLESQLKRTAHDANRPLLQVDNKKETLEKLHKERSPLYEEIADQKYDTTNKSVKAVVDKIIGDLQRNLK